MSQGGLQDWLLGKVASMQLVVAWDLAESLPASQGAWRWQDSTGRGHAKGPCLGRVSTHPALEYSQHTESCGNGPQQIMLISFELTMPPLICLPLHCQFNQSCF